MTCWLDDLLRPLLSSIEFALPTQKKFKEGSSYSLQSWSGFQDLRVSAQATLQCWLIGPTNQIVKHLCRLCRLKKYRKAHSLIRNGKLVQVPVFRKVFWCGARTVTKAEAKAGDCNIRLRNRSWAADIFLYWSTHQGCQPKKYIASTQRKRMRRLWSETISSLLRFM